MFPALLSLREETTALEHFKRVERQVIDWMLTPVRGTKSECPDEEDEGVESTNEDEEPYDEEVAFSDDGGDYEDEEESPYPAWTNESQKISIWKLFLSLRVRSYIDQRCSETFPG